LLREFPFINGIRVAGRIMSYELKPDETLSDGLQRIVRKQIDDALESLRPTVRSKDVAIHEAVHTSVITICYWTIIARLDHDAIGGMLGLATYSRRISARLFS